MENKTQNKFHDTILRCKNCNQDFALLSAEQEYLSSKGWKRPNICPKCRQERNTQRKLERAKALRQKEQEQQSKARVTEQHNFNQALESFTVLPLDSIHPNGANTLYIIGNGFDLMHGVKSSYWSFRQSLPKRGTLLFDIETLLTSANLWSNFEEALASFNPNFMLDKEIVDMWLENFDAYSLDSAAAFSCAIDTAVRPLSSIAYDLPRAFRKWINSLKLGTNDRPLANLITPLAQVLCFNYTEFVETLYDIPKNQVCYIHGCRQTAKGHTKEELILGHAPGATDNNFDDVDFVEMKNGKDALISIAQDQIADLISNCDKELTKNCRDIINEHQAFFDSLKNIQQIIVIGHSYSKVDWPYFREIAKHLTHQPVTWYFGCHSTADLANLQKMCHHMTPEITDPLIFRTDTIDVELLPGPPAPQRKSSTKLKQTDTSGKFIAKTTTNRLVITDTSGATTLDLMFNGKIRQAFFAGSPDYLFVIVKQEHPSVVLFKLEANRWQLLKTLQPYNDHPIVNNRLKHAIINGTQLSFIYNNRISTYSLSTGQLLKAYPKRNAGHGTYVGEDLAPKFLGKQ